MMVVAEVGMGVGRGCIEYRKEGDSSWRNL